MFLATERLLRSALFLTGLLLDVQVSFSEHL
jgi:hypothetical protein